MGYAVGTFSFLKHVLHLSPTVKCSREILTAFVPLIHTGCACLQGRCHHCDLGLGLDLQTPLYHSRHMLNLCMYKVGTTCNFFYLVKS